MSKDMPVTETAKAWVQLSRLPFHTVGVLPFCLGAVLSWQGYSVFNVGLFLVSVAAVILIMLCTYYNGEYCDVIEDRLSANMDKNAFSGGSQVIAQNILPYRYANVASHVALGLAVIAGLIIQFYYRTGWLTIPLGISGMLAGYFYSKMPIRWVAKGVGETIIGFSYGWLPVAVSYYLQTGHIDPVIHWISLPIACTIFNVILINEFPDHPADLIARKNNLVVRLGKQKASYLYILVATASWVTFLLSVRHGVHYVALAFYFPVFIISLFVVILMLRRDYNDKKLLEIMCALTIVTNLGTTLAYILAVWLRGA